MTSPDSPINPLTLSRAAKELLKTQQSDERVRQQAEDDVRVEAKIMRLRAQRLEQEASDRAEVIRADKVSRDGSKLRD